MPSHPTDPCSFESFAALPSNLGAWDAALGFALGRRPLVAIQGAPGWGKTHLLKAAGRRIAELEPLSVHAVSGQEWLHDRRALNPCALLVDDAHLPALQTRSCERLRAELEKRVRSRRPTLCVFGPAPGLSLRKLLPNWGAWLSVAVAEPSPQEREEVLRRMCRNEEVLLSDGAVSLIARLVRGSGHSLLGVITRLKLACGADLSQIDPLRVAGTLNPYLTDQGDYDLRDIVLDAVTRSIGVDDIPGGSGRPSAAIPLAVYAMSALAGLSESSVAAYFGMNSGDVYRLRMEARSRLEAPDATLRAQLDRALALVERSLVDR